MLKYIQAYPTGPLVTEATQSVVDAFAYTDTKLVTAPGLQQGLYTGGNGLYNVGGTTFNPAYVIPWASTEHNLDMWHTLTLAARVLGGGYQAQADNLKDAIVNNLWDTSTNRFYQGIADATTPDTADALDTSSWGAIFLSAIGDYEKAGQALDRVEIYKHTRSGVTGYAPYDPAGQYPGATPTVWFEGTYGVSLSFLRAGLYNEYLESLAQSEDFQSADGSFVYATDLVTTYEISDYDSVASTAWYVLATTGRDDFWVECETVSQPADGSSVDDFYTTNGSPAVPATSSGGGSGKATRACRDPEASNYETFGRSTPSLCEYNTPENSSEYTKFTQDISFIRKETNDAAQVAQLERFLNEYEGESLTVDGVSWARSDSWIGSPYYKCDQWIDDEFLPFMPELPDERGGMRNWMYSSRSAAFPDGDDYQSYKLSAEVITGLGIPEDPTFQHCPANCLGNPSTLCLVTVDSTDKLSITTGNGHARCRY